MITTKKITSHTSSESDCNWITRFVFESMASSSKAPSSPSDEQSTRKRTNTGCLTCRLARVKCDEGRPDCSRCTRLKLGCEWADKHVPLKIRRREEQKKREEARRRQSRAIKQKPAESSASSATGCSGSAESSSLMMFGPELLAQIGSRSAALSPRNKALSLSAFTSKSTDSDLMCNISDDMSLLGPELFRTMDMSSPDSQARASSIFLGYHSAPSPFADMDIASTSLFATLPAVGGPLNATDHQALDYYQKESVFGFGSKSPIWSTHAILLHAAIQNQAVLELLLAAALSEMGHWHHSDSATRPLLLKMAERHYSLGRRELTKVLASNAEPDHLVVMASFWFLYLHQRRRPCTQHVPYAELSVLMGDHVRKYRLHQMMLCTSSSSAAAAGTEAVSPPERKAVLARLTIWLFWADAQSCFQGEGGSMARLLLQSTSPQGMLDLYERSRGTLELYWGKRYPEHELVDDIQNSSALELIHHTWILVQEINEATTDFFLALDAETSRTIKTKMEALRTKFPFSTVFRLTESTARVRDRLLANADWAVCNYYALRIYHFRCSAVADDESVAETVAALLMLTQKSLATKDKGQSDRLQWPLFWAGIETADTIYRDWIKDKLTDRGLKAALEMVLWEQLVVGERIGMDRIRQICRLTAVGGSESGFGVWAA
ncbi:hypothetical protein QBC46DRAFT_394549 [Diplogelasinospora grovesii]|uniref:Zn(2)-C6 fungal-type domain-containing protein n=1 Tax=Diplogelasinospora grovesii TaxID=303347 RepID=A0AAN6N3C9_9PEZI|nr:hypothetical protein QBC46DRAFT_394549 [Diplogelasinospora grovesii]